MATKKTVKEDIKEEAKNEVPVLRGGEDSPLPPIPSNREFITIRGENGTYNIELDGLTLIVLYTDLDGVQYMCDVDLEKI